MRDFDIKKLQQEQIIILKEVDRICKKYNIDYFCTWGTALGAVRHKGFIPWDDDIDISMRWDQLVKFKEVCSKELDSRYFLQNTDTDIYYWNAYNKIRVNNTTSMDMHLTNMKCHYGICMDIFPIIAIPNNVLSRAKQKIYVALYKVLCAIPYVLYIDKNNKGMIAKIMGFFPKTLVRWLRKLLIPNKFIKYVKNFLLKGITKYDFEKSKFWGEILNEPGPRGIFDKKLFEEGKMMPFEDFEVKIPKEYDKYLSKCYGDYMKLPEESQRIGHGATIVDFNKSYIEYQTESY